MRKVLAAVDPGTWVLLGILVLCLLLLALSTPLALPSSIATFLSVIGGLCAGAIVARTSFQ